MSNTDRRRYQDVRSPDPALQRAQEEARDIAKTSQAQGFAGTDVTATLAPATPLAIAHRLGRKPMGWFVLDATGSYPILFRTAWDDKTLTLSHAGIANTTVKLRVF